MRSMPRNLLVITCWPIRGNTKQHETVIRGGANNRLKWVNSSFVDLKRVCIEQYDGTHLMNALPLVGNVIFLWALISLYWLLSLLVGQSVCCFGSPSMGQMSLPHTVWHELSDMCCVYSMLYFPNLVAPLSNYHQVRS